MELSEVRREFTTYGDCQKPTYDEVLFPFAYIDGGNKIAGEEHGDSNKPYPYEKGFEYPYI